MCECARNEDVRADEERLLVAGGRHDAMTVALCVVHNQIMSENDER